MTKRRDLGRQHSLDGSAKMAILTLEGRDPTPSQDVIAEEFWSELTRDLPAVSQTITDPDCEGGHTAKSPPTSRSAKKPLADSYKTSNKGNSDECPG